MKPGAGSPPPALVGRDSERENFDVTAQRLLLGRPDRSQLLIGLRGVGKTVLLREGCTDCSLDPACLAPVSRSRQCF